MLNLTTLELKRCANLSDHVLGTTLKELVNLQKLSVERCRSLTGTFLTAIAHPEQMVALNVAGTKTHDAIFSATIPGMVQLSELVVSGTKYSDTAALAILPVLGRQLKLFECSATKITDASASLLATLSTANNVSICFSEHLYDFTWLKGLDTITVLDLSLCARLEDAHLMHLMHLQVLRELNISKTAISDDGFRYLAGLPCLTKLIAQSLDLSDVISVALKQMPALVHLDLSFCLKVTDAVIQSRCLYGACFERLNIVVVEAIGSHDCWLKNRCIRVYVCPQH
jgi:hypothetical protein